MGYITDDGLKALKAYKYVSGGYSFMDKIFNHWWEFFVKLIPLVSFCTLYRGSLECGSEPDHPCGLDHQCHWHADLHVPRCDMHRVDAYMGHILRRLLLLHVSDPRRCRWEASEKDRHKFASRVTIRSW